MICVFLVSGLIHELVISVPAGKGYGLPTAYFLIQAAALFTERSMLGRRWGLGRGVRGRVFAWACVLLPAAILFHPAFAKEVIVPLVDALGGM